MMSHLVMLLSILTGLWLAIASEWTGMPLALASEQLPSPTPAPKTTEDGTLFQPKRLLLSLGVNSFNDSVFRNLRYASKDADDIWNSLSLRSNPAFDSGFLVNSDSQPTGLVTLKDARNAMARFRRLNTFENDTVFVYVSTHGTLLRMENGEVRRFIVMSDTSSSSVSTTALPYDELISWFKALPSRKKVLVLAFCYGGIGKSVLTPRMELEVARLRGSYFKEPDPEVAEGSVILAASGWREPALEAPELENEVYTHFLLKGFREGDANGDGAVSITEAHAYATEATATFTKEQQNPSAIVEMKGVDPIFVTGKPGVSSRSLLFAGYAQFRRLEARWNGKSLGTLKKGISLPEGKGRLELFDPSNSKLVVSRVTRIDAGQEYLVGDFLHPNFENSVETGYIYSSVVSGEKMKSYVPNSSSGVYARWTSEGLVFGRLDLAVAGSLTFPQSETVQFEGVRFKQERKSYGGNIDLGDRTLLTFLTDGSGAFQSHVLYAAGPGVWCISRSSDSDLLLKKSSQVCKPGGEMRLGLTNVVPSLRMRTSMNISYEGFRSPWGSGTGMVTSLSGAFGVGFAF